MRRVHRHETRVDEPERIEQCERPQAVLRERLLHLASLLAHVRVHGQRVLACIRRNRLEPRPRERADAVRCEPDAHARVTRMARSQRIDVAERIVDVAIDEAPLPRFERAPIARPLVHAAQHRDAQPGVARGAHHGVGEQRALGVGRPVRLVVDVMKLADSRDARHRELDEGEVRERVERLRIDALDERVHQPAPRPEAPRCARAPLRATTQCALKGVRMRRREPRQHVGVAVTARERVHAGATIAARLRRTECESRGPRTPMNTHVGRARRLPYGSSCRAASQEDFSPHSARPRHNRPDASSSALLAPHR